MTFSLTFYKIDIYILGLLALYFAHFLLQLPLANKKDLKLSGLEFTLRQGLPREKLVALRQCIEKIGINKPAGEITLAIRTVPGSNLRATQEFKTSV